MVPKVVGSIPITRPKHKHYERLQTFGVFLFVMINAMFQDKIMRRLFPLYLSSFFQGLIFWYAIEKVFMTSIGFTPTTIAIQISVMAVTGILLEVPSGILADRWSRKGILVVACTALALASFLLGISDSVVGYTLASILYGVYFALHSGAYDSMVYDTLIEVQGSRNGFEKYLGNATLIASVGLIIGSLLGGVIGEKFGLNSAYFWSIPGSLLAIIAAASFKEPLLHKAEKSINVVKHTRDTLYVVFQKGYLAWVVVTLLATSVIYSTLLELSQLWPLALDMGLPWFGPLNALILLGLGIGTPIAAVIIKKRTFLPLAYVLSLCTIFLLTTRNIQIVALAQFGAIVLSISLYTIALGRFHDSLPSSLRSSSSSVISSTINILFIPFIYVFAWLAEANSVFIAAYLLIPFAIISIIGMIIISRRAYESSLTERIKPFPNTSGSQ